MKIYLIKNLLKISKTSFYEKSCGIFCGTFNRKSEKKTQIRKQYKLLFCLLGIKKKITTKPISSRFFYLL